MTRDITGRRREVTALSLGVILWRLCHGDPRKAGGVKQLHKLHDLISAAKIVACHGPQALLTHGSFWSLNLRSLRLAVQVSMYSCVSFPLHDFALRYSSG